MSDLEDEASPFLESMIRGHGRTLYDHGREIVAYWALKTAMMIDFAQEAEHRCVPTDDFPALYATRGVLPNTFIWLGACVFGSGALARHRTLEVRSGTSCTSGFDATIGVGHLVIHIIRAEVEEGRTIEIGGNLADALHPLWPRSRPLQWPPRTFLTREQVVLLGQMVDVSPLGASRFTTAEDG